MNPIRCVSMVVLLAGLAGCGNGNDVGDLDSFMS